MNASPCSPSLLLNGSNEQTLNTLLENWFGKRKKSLFICFFFLCILNLLPWIFTCELWRGGNYTYSVLNSFQVLSILKKPFIIQQHSLYPCDIQHAWCLGPIPSLTRLFYCMIAVFYINLLFSHPPIYPSYSLSSLLFPSPLLLLCKGRSVWVLWIVFLHQVV